MSDKPLVLFAIAGDWGLPDPKAQDRETVRQIRDLVKAKARRLAGALAVSSE